jgi:hypothetical protein
MCIYKDKKHDHNLKRVTRISFEIYFMSWVKLYSEIMYLKVETNERYAAIEELVRFCEEHLIQGNTIEGEFLSFQIDNLSNTAIAVGEIFEGKIIPLVRVCNCVELEGLQEGLARLQKFLADNSCLRNIDLEWVYKPYKNIFKKAVLNLPRELGQNTINLFTQL